MTDKKGSFCKFLILLFIHCTAPQAIAQKTTGIWYEIWYTNTGDYVWTDGHGVGSTHQLTGDVNGDCKADAIVFWNNWQDGVWYVATSSGSRFNDAMLWASGFGGNADDVFAADVDGDGDDDAIAFFAGSGQWWVARSSRSGFGTPQLWIDAHGIGSTARLMGDINADGRADAVVFWDSWQDGAWYAAISDGSAFTGARRWAGGHGGAGSKPLLGDVSGEGRADAIVYKAESGNWLVARSDGSRFVDNRIWIDGHGVGSDWQLLGDVDNDGRQDALVYWQNWDGGTWYVAESTGSRFDEFYRWLFLHGGGGFGQSAVNRERYSRMQALAATSGSCGDRKGDAAVVYFADEGSWRVLPPGVPGDAGYFPSGPEYNSWQAWDMRVFPRTGGVFRQYDSAETTVIDEHLQMISDAGIDFLIIDVTNDVARDWLTRRAQAVIRRIRQWNRAHREPLLYAIAIGPTVLPQTPEDLENQARLVWQRLFFNSADDLDGSDYFYLHDTFDGQDKPLLIVEDGIRRQQAGDLIRTGEWAGRFTLKWWGAVSEQNIPQAEWGDYYGWVFYDGALPNADAMHVQPGHVNPAGRICRFYPYDRSNCPISRVPQLSNASADSWYARFNWERVLAADPAMVIINSFNEYGEETALAPADTSRSLGEKWYNPLGRLDADYYWNLTIQYNNLFKQ